MTSPTPSDPNPPRQTTVPEKPSFEQQAVEAEPGLIMEFWDFLRFNGKWWMTPILIVMLLVAALLVLNALGLTPFVYTTF